MAISNLYSTCTDTLTQCDYFTNYGFTCIAGNLPDAQSLLSLKAISSRLAGLAASSARFTLLGRPSSTVIDDKVYFFVKTDLIWQAPLLAISLRKAEITAVL